MSMRDSRSSVVAQAAAAERLMKLRTPSLHVSHVRQSRLLRIAHKHAGNGIEAQHRRLLAAASSYDITHIDARDWLDIMAFHARLAELQKAGYSFSRRWVRQTTTQGNEHRVMAYRLVRQSV